MTKISSRLNRIIGQLNGLAKMLDEKQDCEKIIIQFQAAKAALESAFAEALNENLANCLRKKDSRKMKNILRLISKK